MFVRMCPSFPFSARVCVNQHYWLANRLAEEESALRRPKCVPEVRRLRASAGTRRFLTAKDLLEGGQKWLIAFTPFFTARERKDAGCRHRLLFAQVEYCDNLIFHRRAALDPR
jgi:hypothetical protein